MKIGILTFHRPANFGANLQAYSSVQYFKSLGHEVIVIDYTRSIDLDYKKSVNSIQFDAHKSFVESCLPLSQQVYNSEELCCVVKKEQLDLILIGADAVWRKPNDGCIFFANWLFNTPELSGVSVASISPAHMGNGFSLLDDKTKNTIKECLSRFKFITVRDEWTKHVINRDIFGGYQIVQHINPDPVTVLYRFIDNECWNSNSIEKEKYVVMTLPVNWNGVSKRQQQRLRWFNKFKSYINKAGLILVELPLPEGKSGMVFDYTIDYPIDPLQWFLWLKNAKAFCGMRFHSIVSSISSGTPFYSIDYYGNNGMLSILLDILGLHKWARKADKTSKIRNLLLRSGFEANRTGRYLEFESPYKVFNLLMNTSRESVEQYRTQLETIFDRNMNALLDAVKE